jgi:hypothetical protein
VGTLRSRVVCMLGVASLMGFDVHGGLIKWWAVGAIVLEYLTSILKLLVCGIEMAGGMYNCPQTWSVTHASCGAREVI